MWSPPPKILRSKRILACTLIFITLLSLPTRLHHSQENETPFPSDYTPFGDPNSSIALVIASLNPHETLWLTHAFPTWTHYIYTPHTKHATGAALTVPCANKGREALPYLTYIITHYSALHPVTLFLHAQRYQWHNDDPDYDGLRVLSRLNLSHVREEGYVNLRCDWALGCPTALRPLASAPGEADEVFRAAWGDLFLGEDVPGRVGAGCCAQFAVSAETVRKRGRGEYVRMREWLLRTELEDQSSGRVFEYAWHVIFGKAPVHCVDARECYCKLYGLCELECKRGSCKDRYVLPPSSTLPDGWPWKGWDGEDREVAET